MTEVTYAPGPPRIRRRLVRAVLPYPLLRHWQIARTANAINGYLAHNVSHTYHGVPLTIRIADPAGELWYDHDWPTTVLPELEALRAVLKPGATAFEIGAHQGIVALIMGALVGKTGKIIAVEANEHNASLTLENVLLNGMPQVIPITAAVSERPGQVFFQRYGEAVTNRKAGARRVPAVTVDQLAKLYGEPDLLWIDVEGHECQVLRGAQETMGRRPTVCLEVHAGALLEEQNGTVEEALSFLKGYDLWWNSSPNSRLHDLEPFDSAIPPSERFSVVAFP